MHNLSIYDANERTVCCYPRLAEHQPLIRDWKQSLLLMVNREFCQGSLSVSQVAVGTGYVLCLLRCDSQFLCPFYICWHEGISTAAWEAAENNLIVAASEYGAQIQLAWPAGPPPPTPWVATVRLEHRPGVSTPPSTALRANEIGVAWALIDFFSE